MTESENERLGESIKSLVGIELIERLKNDLKIYKTRLLKNNNTNDSNTQIENLQNEIKKIEKEQEKLLAKQATIEVEIKQKEDQIKKYEQKFAAQGGGFTSKKKTGYTI